MRRFLIAATAVSMVLSGCSGGGAGSGGDEAALLANGMPAYEGFAETDQSGESTDANNGKHEIVYSSAGSTTDIYDFYRGHYTDAGNKLSTVMMNFASDQDGYGGYVQVFNEGEQVMVHVSPKKGSGAFDLASNLGDGFPVYPGVDAGDYDVNDRSDGSRLVIFRLKEDPSTVMEFYRDAGVGAGYTIDSAHYDGSSETERVTLHVNEGTDDRNVRVTRYDKS